MPSTNSFHTQNVYICYTSSKEPTTSPSSILQLNFVQNRILWGGEMYQVPDQCTKIVLTKCKLVHTQCKIVYTQKHWYLI
jgi:hypothetical protein